MFSSKAFLLALVSFAIRSSAAPTTIRRREVPQEHSHQPFLTSVQTSLLQNNPNELVDSVFGLLGNAAASQGLGKLTDPECLQTATADQAFTNAKAAGDVQSMVDALIYRALERNTGAVGLASNSCTSFQPVNPEIAAIQQHQDPASDNAASVNKAIVLELAKQIASVGGNATDALKSGTFAPGTIGDPTAKGNTCDDANDALGCIFTDNLLVPDATVDEINAAVAGISSSSASSTASDASTDVSSSDSAASCAATVTVTVGASAPAATATGTAAASPSNAAAGQNLQTFTGNLGGISAPPVTTSGTGFAVQGESGNFVNLAAALGRSCDVQHNQCADAANSGQASGVSVSECDTQDTQCKAAGA